MSFIALLSGLFLALGWTGGLVVFFSRFFDHSRFFSYFVEFLQQIGFLLFNILAARTVEHETSATTFFVLCCRRIGFQIHTKCIFLLLVIFLAVFIVIHCFSCSNVLLAEDSDPASEIVIMFNLVPVSRLPRVMFCARFRMAF